MLGKELLKKLENLIKQGRNIKIITNRIDNIIFQISLIRKNEVELDMIESLKYIISKKEYFKLDNEDLKKILRWLNVYMVVNPLETEERKKINIYNIRNNTNEVFFEYNGEKYRYNLLKL